jgi:cell division septal protein FtsQ
MVYDPDDPQNTRIKSGIRRKSAYIMIIIAILVLFVGWLNYYTATKYRAVAAANTVGMVADYAF